MRFIKSFPGDLRLSQQRPTARSPAEALPGTLSPPSLPRASPTALQSRVTRAFLAQGLSCAISFSPSHGQSQILSEFCQVPAAGPQPAFRQGLALPSVPVIRAQVAARGRSPKLLCSQAWRWIHLHTAGAAPYHNLQGLFPSHCLLSGVNGKRGQASFPSRRSLNVFHLHKQTAQCTAIVIS